METHVVQSEDGYLSTLHRIPYGRKNDTVGRRPVVFIQHGIMCSSDVWVYSGPETDLRKCFSEKFLVSYNLHMELVL